MVMAAMDIDFQKIYCVDSEGTILAKAEPGIDVATAAVTAANLDLLLIEVASPVFYQKGADPGVVHNVLKWALWNIYAASYINDYDWCEVLVAPSHVWTKGHALKLRHEIAGCKQKQKDLRECEAMMFYYRANPESWVPLHQYMKDLR
jgi:hypothetical protein